MISIGMYDFFGSGLFCQIKNTGSNVSGAVWYPKTLLFLNIG